MKKNFIRRILITLCFTVFMLASAIGVAFSMPKSARAESAIPQGVFEMEDGVSLQFSQVGGMRFIVKMDEAIAEFVKETEGAELGFVIAPKNLMEAANGDYLNMPKKIGGAIDKAKIYSDGEYSRANGCITNIKYANLTRSFTAIAYIKYNGEVRYTDYNNKARNNLYDLVNMAALYGYASEIFEAADGYSPYVDKDGAGAEDTIGWFGTEEFPIVIENTEEYNGLVNAVNAGVDFTDYTIVVKNDATPSEGYNESVTVPTVIDGAVDELNKLIAALPDSVTMPEAIGQIGRIRDAEKKYNALSDAKKSEIENYAKVESLLPVIEGYDRVYKNDATDGTVIPSYVPNYTSTVGGSATTRTDDLYGNVLTVVSDADGKAALSFTNFPSVENYRYIYFYVKVSVGCDLYLSDGITNDGWGNNWKNTWSISGLWCNENNWRLVTIPVSSGYIGTDFALGFRTNTTGFTFEISDFYGVVNEKFATIADLSFGKMTDTGTENEYGKVYNLATQWGGDTDFQSFEVNALSNALQDGKDYYYFWIYNPTANDVTMELVVTGGSWPHLDATTLTAGAWTKFVISSEAIEYNKSYGIVCCVNQGASTAGWQMSSIYMGESLPIANLSFGKMTDTGTENEYGKVYNLATQWGGDTDFQSFEVNALSNALQDGKDYYYFWIYNPTANDVTMELVVTGGSWPHLDATTLTAGAWTKFVISSEAIEHNKTYDVVCCVNQGASTAGWQMSPIYFGPETIKAEIVYLDHADVKATIALINALPATVTLDNKAAVEGARAAYDNLTAAQQTLVNATKLVNAEKAIQDIESANEVVALIAAINPRAVDEAAVAAAREAYNALSDTAKGYVTNLATLEGYEADIQAKNNLTAQVNSVNTLIANLPDEVIMPDHLVFVTRIEKARDAYNALSDEGKAQVTNYAKLRTLILAIKGYETVHVQTVDGVNVIPSHVPNYTSTIGGTATMGYDGYYGDYLKVTPNAGGKVAIQFINFPDVSQYEKIYFNIRVVGTSCDIYLSDGITNDGWGDNWHNTWSMSGFYANNGNWIQKEVDPATGILSYNWALGLRTEATDVSFEITNIIGVKPDLGEATTLTFGNFTDTGTTNVYGTVYNFTQGWTSETDLGAFNSGIMRSGLKEGHDSLRFYIYNPNESDVVFYTNENDTWIQTELATLTAKAWTEVVLTPSIISSNDTYLTYICVRSGANTSGWQVSPIYSFSMGDAVDKVQQRIDALDIENIDEYKVQLAREAFEALEQTQKELVDLSNLIDCEASLYDTVENAPFIVDGVTQYKLYVAQTEASGIAEFTSEQIATATGVTLPTVTGVHDNLSQYCYAIVFGGWDIYAELGGEKKATDVTSRAGYVIEKMGRTVFILANSVDGYRMGALAFLNEVVGYDMISEDCIVYDAEKAKTLPEFDKIANPFDYRQQQTYMTKEEVYGMGLQAHDDIWISSELGMDMHNTLDYLPQETYGSAHPTWYYDYTDSYGVERTDICPTAGGSTEQYDEMISTIANALIARITAYPTIENISFSMEDAGDGGECTCVRCTEYATLYGSFASAWIDLMNDVNAIVQAHINENMPGRKLNIAFLAYRATEKAPANDDYTPKYRYEMDGKEFVKEDGEYVQDSEYLRCDEGVTVWLAPINGLYAENLNHADNAETLATVKKWCALSDSVYIWAYGTNFKNYMYPYNSWKASAENYKILADMGVKAVWSQSNETEATAFSDLKGYIDSKFMADVNADYEKVLEAYFTNYYGAGATKMRAMFDAIVARCEEIEADYDGLGRGIYDEIENTSGFLGMGAKTYWEKSWLESLVTLCDEAKAAVDADSTLTDAQKTAIKNRITKESLFPRYVLCSAYASSYSSSTKKTMRQAFKEDATALGLTLYKEADGLLSDLYSDWGV